MEEQTGRAGIHPMQVISIRTNGCCRETVCNTRLTCSNKASVDMGAYESRGTDPDLVAVKSNSTGDVVTAGYPFTWTIAVTNVGPTGAGFGGSQVILQDDLPATGVAYGTPVVTGDITTGIFPNNAINCTVTDSTLRCVSTGVTVTIGADTGHFQVAIPVTPTALAVLDNPRSGGKCRVDPDGYIPGRNRTEQQLRGQRDSRRCRASSRRSMTLAMWRSRQRRWATQFIGRVTFLLRTGSLTPTGQVTLTLHDTSDCTDTPVLAEVKTLVDGKAASGTISARSFYYKVTYGGDSNHLPAISACTLFSGPSTRTEFTVNTALDDTFDNVCSDIHCTLREAIEAANRRTARTRSGLQLG